MEPNNEDSSALLGHSEVFAVKHSPRQTVPEFIQRLEYDGEVSSSVAVEKAVDVFEDDDPGKSLSEQASKVVKQA
jgi:hypothetical protein